MVRAGGKMIGNETIKYIKSMLRSNNLKVNREFEVINDSFTLYNINSDSLQGILFLLDENNTVAGIKGVYKNTQELVGKTFNLPFKEETKLGEIIRYINNGFCVYCLKEKNYKSKEMSYSLCYIVDKKSQNDESLVKNIAFKINKSIEILNKYNEKKNFLLRYLDSIDEGISTCDRNGVITYVNKACCDILGFNREDIFNREKGISPEYKPILSKILKKKESIIDADYFPKRNNKTIHLINSSYPVFDHKKEVIGAIDVFRGIKRTTKLANTLVGQNVNYRFENIIGKSWILKEKIRLAKSFALSDANIYIQGESGTGKELFAQSIHNYSRRNNEPFVALNCANFPLELVDSELFGYEEGAFTGAKKGGKIGKFELANGGTLFLDEIGEMQLHIQAKLLRVLETRTLSRIGGNKSIKINVKVIAATNRNLYEMVKKGEFREDLYYRLKVLFLEIPPLRQREGDIILLTHHYIRKIGYGMGKKVKGVDKEGEKLLLKYHWPGNIRELENIIARALFICNKDIITKEDLIKAGVKLDYTGEIIKNNLNDINREVLIKTLKQTKGNKKRTAEILGVSRPTIYRMMKKYDVKV